MLEKSDRFGIETALAATGQLAGSFTKNPIYAARLQTYVDLLRTWQRAQNLVSGDTLNLVWERHIADGAQLMPLLKVWRDDKYGSRRKLRGIDLGSGGGLPGLVVALLGDHPISQQGVSEAITSQQDDLPQLSMTLVEATARKVSFLRTVSRETAVPVQVINARIEDLSTLPPIPGDFITARALAPLSVLGTMASPWLNHGATAFFHKGGEYAREIEEWPDAGAHHVVEHKSAIDPRGCILQITRKA